MAPELPIALTDCAVVEPAEEVAVVASPPPLDGAPFGIALGCFAGALVWALLLLPFWM